MRRPRTAAAGREDRPADYSALFSNAFVFHSLHHARWTGRYSFQSALMDRLFGTEWKDWRELHREVAAGQPLKSLCETRRESRACDP